MPHFREAGCQVDFGSGALKGAILYLPWTMPTKRTSREHSKGSSLFAKLVLDCARGVETARQQLKDPSQAQHPAIAGIILSL